MNFGVEIGWTFIFQVINLLVLVGVVCLVYNILVKTPRRIMRNDEKILEIERKLDDLSRRIDKSRDI